MDNNEANYFCRICGYRLDESPYGYDGQTPSFDFCPCCDVEFGYQDCQLSAIRAYRAQWLKKEAQNNIQKMRELEKQLINVPKQFL